MPSRWVESHAKSAKLIKQLEHNLHNKCGLCGTVFEKTFYTAPAVQYIDNSQVRVGQFLKKNFD